MNKTKQTDQPTRSENTLNSTSCLTLSWALWCWFTIFWSLSHSLIWALSSAPSLCILASLSFTSCLCVCVGGGEGCGCEGVRMCVWVWELWVWGCVGVRVCVCARVCGCECVGVRVCAWEGVFMGESVRQATLKATSRACLYLTASTVDDAFSSSASQVYSLKSWRTCMPAYEDTTYYCSRVVCNIYDHGSQAVEREWKDCRTVTHCSFSESISFSSFDISSFLVEGKEGKKAFFYVYFALCEHKSSTWGVPKSLLNWHSVYHKTLSDCPRLYPSREKKGRK